MTSTPADPLAALLARLRAADPDLELIAGRPTSAGWVDLAEPLEDPGCVERWLDRIRPETAGSDAVAGSFLASWLGGVVVAPLYRALIRERRTWPCRASGVLVRQHEDGWFDGLAIAGRTLRVLPGDEWAGSPDVDVFDDVTSLHRSVVEDLAQTLGPVFAAIRRQTRLGMPAMWGSVADTIGAIAMADAVAHAEDPRGAFADATCFVDELATTATVTMPRVRPTFIDVAWSGGTTPEMIRGTCCLWYRTQPDPDPCGEGFCDSCPRRDPVDQVRRWTASYEESSRAGAPT